MAAFLSRIWRVSRSDFELRVYTNDAEVHKQNMRLSEENRMSYLSDYLTQHHGLAGGGVPRRTTGVSSTTVTVAMPSPSSSYSSMA